MNKKRILSIVVVVIVVIIAYALYTGQSVSDVTSGAANKVTNTLK